jgi:hypothetical protein
LHGTGRDQGSVFQPRVHSLDLGQARLELADFRAEPLNSRAITSWASTSGSSACGEASVKLRTHGFLYVSVRETPGFITGAGGNTWAGGEHMPTWLLIVLIVLVVLALTGGIGYRRR